MLVCFCLRRSTFNCFLFVMVTQFSSYLKRRILIDWYLSSTTRVTSSVNETKAPRHFGHPDWWKISLFRQEGCWVFSLLKYSWSKVLRFPYLTNLVIPNAMDPKVAKLFEGKTHQEKFQAIAFSFGCLLTRPAANSPPDAPMKGKAVHIYSILGCVFTVALFVARLKAKCYCSFVYRWA